MNYILCTAEKPSVALDIAKVLGATKKERGYYEGNGYKVTWAVGHLVGLAEPEAYGYMKLSDLWDKNKPENRKKALAELPIIPEEFKLKVLEPTREQYEVVKKLMNDSCCDYIIDCGDAGPEGHILQWLIRVKSGCKKNVKRFIATSMTEEAILNGMKNLQPIEKYEAIIKAEYCKKRADWIMGMSLSRGASIIYNAKVDVGRVQSPTLFFVVKRYLDVMNFNSKDYYTLQAKLKEGFTVFWKRDNKDYLKKEWKDENNLLINFKVADEVKNMIQKGETGRIILLDSRIKITNRPQLYDITELERDGNRIWGYTADQVLQVAQSLYEKHKITTYPRTDSRFLTHDLIPLLEKRIKDLAAVQKYNEVCTDLLNRGLKLDNRIVDDSKVSDHHAIIITDRLKNFDFTKLSEKESNILHLIIKRMITAFSDVYKYQETNIQVSFTSGLIFEATGKVPISQGWKLVERSLGPGALEKEGDSDEEQQSFPLLQLGQTVHIQEVTTNAKKTQPPKLHTEATLLSAMENAGSFVEGGEILKGKGIGTQATRAAIIKQLFEKGYVKNIAKRKVNYVIPTKQGVSVIKVLPSELYSPQITADWENQISEIVQGSLSEDCFMKEFKNFIHVELQKVISEKKDGVDFYNDKVSVGNCPWCKNPVYEGNFEDKNGVKIRNVYCSNKQCKFSIRKDNIAFKIRTGHDLKVSQLKELVEHGMFEAICLSKEKNKYTGIFCIRKNENGYAELFFYLSERSYKQRYK